MTIIPAKPNTENSLATLKDIVINAGESTEWRIFPEDLNENKINFIDYKTNPNLTLSKFTATVQKQGENTIDEIKTPPVVSSDKKSIFWAYSQKKAGDYIFSGFYEGKKIFSNNNILKVNGLKLPVWEKTDLSKLEEKSNEYVLYNKVKFTHDKANNNPLFKITIYDKFDNEITTFPNDWKFRMNLQNSRQLSTEKEIEFCPGNNTNNNLLALCQDGKQSNGKLNASEVWPLLSTNIIYELKLHLTGSSSNTKLFNILITGPITDPGVTNLDKVVKNTVIIPKSLMKLTAGIMKPFIIEMRTTNANLRPNEWFQTPQENISLTFKYDNNNNAIIKYTIDKGEKIARYNIELTSFKVYSLDLPNMINVFINNEALTTYYPKFYVIPGEIAKMYVTDYNLSRKASLLKGSTVDEIYTAYFTAVDTWENFIHLTEKNMINFNLKLDTSSIVFTNSFLENGIMKVVFQPKKNGTYNFNFPSISNNFPVDFTQGKISPPHSLATVSCASTKIAGDIISIDIIPRDKWENVYILTDKQVKDAFINYYYKLPNMTESYIRGINSALINVNDQSQVSFKQMLTMKGKHLIKVQIFGEDLNVIQSYCRVEPSSFDFTKSPLFNFDEESSRFIEMSINEIIQEKNLEEVPIYNLRLRDKYENIIDDFPNKEKEFFTLKLSGNGINSPINYQKTSISGESLPFTINKPGELHRYQTEGKLTKLPYNMELNYDNTKIKFSRIFKVTLLGQGLKDINATIEPFNVTNTFIDPKEVKIIAGESASIEIELRSDSNQRKINVMPEFTFHFKEADNKKEGNYQANVSKHDLRGKYVITVTGTKSNIKIGPTEMTIVINKTHQVPSKVKITIIPGPLIKAEILTTFNKTYSTDKDVKFILKPMDKYGNIPSVTAFDINLKIKHPSNGPTISPDSKLKDSNTEFFTCSVLTRLAGIYTIISPLLSGNPPTFTVLPGLPFADKSSVFVSPTELAAGVFSYVKINVVDKSGNHIPADRGDLKNAVVLKVKDPNNLEKTYALTSSNNKQFLEGSWNITKVGQAIVSVIISGETLQCSSCLLTYSPGPLNIKNTKFFVKDNANNYGQSFSLESNYGSSDLNVKSFFFDSFDNPIEKLTNQENFKTEVSGNNIGGNKVPMPFTTQKIGLNALITVPNDQKDTFEKLVPNIASSPYIMKLTYLNNSIIIGYINVDLNILGTLTDAGNGPVDGKYTYFNKSYINLIAGIKGYIEIELRTSESKRFNGIIDINKVVPFDFNKTTSGLAIKIFTGEKNGRYILELETTKALQKNDRNLVTIDVERVRATSKFTVYVNPTIPDLSKTEITKPLPNVIEAKSKQTIKFKLFDKYNNQFKKEEFRTKIFAKASKGVATFKTPSLISNDEYEIEVYPSYPPKNLEVLLYYIKEDNSTVSFLKTPIVSLVKTTLAPEKTEIHGSDLLGKSVNKKISFEVILKDNVGFCYYKIKNVSVVIHGPYISNKMTNNQINEQFEPFSQVYQAKNKTGNGDTYSCNVFYEVDLPAESLKNIGYYQVDVKIEGINNNLPVYKQRTILMTSGLTEPKSTIISLPKFFNQGTKPRLFKFKEEFTIFFQLHDKFKNIINENRTGQTFDFKIKGYDTNDYKKVISNLFNGTFKVDVQVSKSGILNNIDVIINGITVKWVDLDKIDCPEALEITAGACSSKINVSKMNPVYLGKKNIIIGEKFFFLIHCMDIYGNKLTTGGSKFSVDIFGLNLTTVKTDRIPNIIEDKKNGIYNISFVVSWPGKYDFTIALENEPYTNFSLTAQSSLCPDKNNPIYCVHNGKCTNGSYLNCKMPGFDCPTTDKFYRCFKNGKLECTEGTFKCDCNSFKSEAGSVQCKGSDNKCVPKDKVNKYCASKMNKICPAEFPYKCNENGGGVCRINKENCPSQPGCPPGYRLCYDQTCVAGNIACKDPIIKECTGEKIFRCEDQSCAKTAEECPTRITCPKPGMIICSDKTCVNSELECRIPANCERIGLILCSDQSCKKRLEDCPKSIVCPENYALCEDGSCKISCVDSKQQQQTSRILVKMDRLLIQNKTKLLGPETKFGIQCPGGEKAHDFYSCSTTETCPLNSVQCPDFSCAASLSECVVRICKPGEFHCKDGKCVKSKSHCSTLCSCPDELPVKCSDKSCVEKNEDCSPIIPCPLNQPYKCTGGECRAKSEECPTLISCPAELPIKCCDGSCKTARYHCLDVAQQRKCIGNQAICPDGSCALSKQLCSTTQSCLPNQVRCWDNSCENSLDKCQKIDYDQQVCPSNTPLKCPGGTCSSSLSNCPTQIICPITSPIKCDDGNCRESISQCTSNTDCGLDLTRCPDGSCSADKVCGTPITCSTVAPYICYDNTCRRDPTDCPKMPNCPKNAPILCSDGNCVNQRINCIGFDKCDPTKPVRCPNLNCYPSVDDCEEIHGCPAGKVKCDDGSCATNALYCSKQSCPSYLPYKCEDGFCVNDKKFCDNSKGCPYNKPNKCKNGLCVADLLKDCPNNNKLKCPKGNDTLCDDGSCAIDTKYCPNILGCPPESPLKCASGNCINPKTTSCSIAVCPAYAPVKCLDGLCVLSSSNCRSFLSSEDFQQCFADKNGNNVPCADGRCVSSSSQCRPIYECPLHEIRCSDGSCRKVKELCPFNITNCPDYRPFRCSVGACAKSEEDCPTQNGCPIKAPLKCDYSGYCAKNETECDIIESTQLLLNKCTPKKSFKCSDFKTCAENSKACPAINQKICSSPNSFKCPIDDSCVASQADCLNKNYGCLVSNNTIKCPDGTCSSSYDKCKAKNGCPIMTPFRCADGTCISNQFSLNGEQGCKPTIKCPMYKPYLCANGECQGDFRLCKVELPCPKSFPHRCYDQTCVKNSSECKELTHCPTSAPVLCKDGKCSSSIDECKESKEMFCPLDKHIFCASGICGSKPSDCFPSSTIGAGKRLLQSTVNNYDFGCNSQLPNRCYDGSCKKNKENCEIFPGCRDPQLPIICPSGDCVAKSDDCNQKKPNPLNCPQNLVRCEDGTCRSNCLHFNGCPLDRPLYCPSGFCARELAECAGESSCPFNRPIRCRDNLCKTFAFECKRGYKTYSPQPQLFTISNSNTQTIEIIKSDQNDIKYGSIIFPAGSLLENSQSLNNLANNAQRGFYVLPVSDSLVNTTTASYIYERKFYIRGFIPLLDNKLNFNQAVRSPIVKLKAQNRDSSIDYRFNLILYLSTDILENSDINLDYCLGKLNEKTREWDCQTRTVIPFSNQTSENKIGFLVKNDGIYSVLFNPSKLPIQSETKCDWFCQNRVLLLYIGIGLIIFFFVVSYVTWRVSRYVTKYRLAKREMANFKEQISEMEKAATDVQGQTIKDKIEGITFTANPAFKEEPNKGIYFLLIFNYI